MFLQDKKMKDTRTRRKTEDPKGEEDQSSVDIASILLFYMYM